MIRRAYLHQYSLPSLALAGFSILLAMTPMFADAGLIRRGGTSTAAAPTQPGTAVYLLPKTLFSGQTVNSGQVVAYSLDATALTGAARFSFTDGDGAPFQVHHSWGKYCSEIGYLVEAAGTLPGCYFSLGRDESLLWSGHVVGVPQLPLGDPNALPPARPGFAYKWRIWSLGDPDNSVIIEDAALGAYLTFDQAVESSPEAYANTDGCFVAAHGYDEGGCQFIELGGGGIVTGQSLIDLLGTTAFELSLAATYTAPQGYAFYTANGESNQNGEVTFSLGGNDWTELVDSSRRMQLRINNVPIPGVIPLLFTGLLAIWVVVRCRRQNLLRVPWIQRGTNLNVPCSAA